MSLEVGQVLWFVPSGRYRRASNITITKVGRKWAETDQRLRLNIDTLYADGAGYSSPGRAWPTKAAWEAETARHEAWHVFRAAVDRHWSAPDHLTTEQIATLSGLLIKTEPAK